MQRRLKYFPVIQPHCGECAAKAAGVNRHHIAPKHQAQRRPMTANRCRRPVSSAGRVKPWQSQGRPVLRRARVGQKNSAVLCQQPHASQRVDNQPMARIGRQCGMPPMREVAIHRRKKIAAANSQSRLMREFLGLPLLPLRHPSSVQQNIVALGM